MFPDSPWERRCSTVSSASALVFISLPCHTSSLVSRLRVVPILLCHIALGLPNQGTYLTLLQLPLACLPNYTYKLSQSRKCNQFTLTCWTQQCDLLVMAFDTCLLNGQRTGVSGDWLVEKMNQLIAGRENERNNSDYPIRSNSNTVSILWSAELRMKRRCN